MTTANVTEMPQNSPEEPAADPMIEARKQWMGVLARADINALEQAWDCVKSKPVFRHMRVPETGMAMVRGRAGGTGKQFNLGEMTMTRCSVSMHTGDKGTENVTVGHGYVAGCDKRHAELAAMFDALLQMPDRQPELMRQVIEPLNADFEARSTERDEKTAATKVDFFTMVRGED